MLKKMGNSSSNTKFKLSRSVERLDTNDNAEVKLRAKPTVIIHSPGDQNSGNKTGKAVVQERLHDLYKELTLEETAENQPCAELTKEKFVQYFACCHKDFGDVLWRYYQLSVRKTLSILELSNTNSVRGVSEYSAPSCGRNLKKPEDLPPTLGRDRFVQISQDILALHTDAQKMKYFLHVFASGTETLSRADVKLMVYSCYVCSVWSSGFTQPLSLDVCLPYIEAVITSVASKADYVSVDTMNLWLKKSSPQMLNSCCKWLTARLLTIAQPVDDICKCFTSETNMTPEDLLHPTVEWLLSCSLPPLYIQPPSKAPNIRRVMSGQLSPHDFVAKMLFCLRPLHWVSLYKSNHHGLSVNRLQHHVFSYKGPTVMLLSAEDNILVCLAVDYEWREGTTRWGDKNCLAIQIMPTLKLLESGPKLFYLNLTSRGSPYGLFVGSNRKTPEVQVDKDLTILYVRKHASRLKSIEVWGCAGEGTLDAQLNQKQWEDQQAQRNRKVNLNSVSWKENPDKYLLRLASRPGTEDYSDYR